MGQPAKLSYTFKIELGKIILVTATLVQDILLILCRGTQERREFWLTRYSVVIVPTRWWHRHHVCFF